MPYVLMIQKQWLVAHYNFSVFEEKKHLFFILYLGRTIRFEYSNVLEHQQKQLYRRQRRQQQCRCDDSHCDNSTSGSIVKQTIHIFLSFSAITLVWQLIARFYFSSIQHRPNICLHRTLNLLFPLFFNNLSSISNFHANFVFFSNFFKNNLSVSSLPFLSPSLHLL